MYVYIIYKACNISIKYKNICKHKTHVIPELL